MGGVYTRVQNVASLRPGDHVCIWDYSRWPLSYQHHGIVWASGATVSDIRVCHVWSPLEGFQEAQADSCFRISTLEEFLYNRKHKHLRLVEYHTSGLREILSRWGEVHLSKADLPEVVLARCKFLLGLGRGDFNIFTQNCEHAAHWCMTGEQWCKQTLTKVRGRVPFEKRLAKEDVDALVNEIEEIKAISRSIVNNLLMLSGSKVFLRVKGNHYVHVQANGRVGIERRGENPTTDGQTAFRLECYARGYNSIRVRFFHEESGCYMFSRSTFSCFRDIRMKKPRMVRGKSGLTWEYSTLGYLRSMNQHRRYVGTRDDGLLLDVSMRGEATRVEFVACEAPPEEYTPPDIHQVTRTYNHEKSVQCTESQSMRDYEAAEFMMSSPTSSTTTPSPKRSSAIAALPPLIELGPHSASYIGTLRNWSRRPSDRSNLTLEIISTMGGVYTRVHSVSSLRPGDHICIWDYSRWPFSYQHHGIVWASGDQLEDIRVCHVWSPLQGYKEAQADSCFRISTLDDFLYQRSLKDLRLVEYHTSAFRDFLSKWGEVHRGKSDLPEVVLARCKFLLGLGKGDFNIFTQNCEHAAHWCKTGHQWSKQILTKVHGRVPFENRLAKEDIDALEKEIDEIKQVSRTVVKTVLKLSGTKVYLRIDGNKYVRIMDDGLHLAVIHEGENPETCGRTAFQLECYSKQYNCVKVAFFHEESRRYMFSRSTFSCFRDLRMKKGNCLRGTSGMRWEYSSAGHLNSMNQHRRYIGVRDDGLLVDVSLRENASRFEFVPYVPPKVAATDQADSYVPPDITLIKRSYNHAKSVRETRSQSMLEFEEEQRGLPDLSSPL
ncbi:hypothetical protein PsorP6_006384 [Peronosclerospora sorghi]|uniref:Uncharacterized protein n=1 Tax=Peronosclerospora sorghi TaxID=230839 RepID=A0ACC0W486_9STRA|nr:hypothetical protein PsorP6_006384 [Peronosclerospora sorghi]